MAESELTAVSDLDCFLHDQFQKLRSLERNVNKVSTRFGRRERALLAQILTLHKEISDQKVQFHKKIGEFHSLLHPRQNDDRPVCPAVNAADLTSTTEESALVVAEQLEQMHPSPASTHTTIATQTDPVTSDDDDDDDVHDCLPLVRIPFREGEQMERLEMAVEGFIDDTDLEDQCSQLRNLEYEEVTLQRSTSRDRLGITLCYGPGEDIETDIFVSEIEPLSIAGRDGRIREGDQILQINGEDVDTRDKAVQLFLRDSQTVTILLARNTDSSQAEELESVNQSLSPMPEQVAAEEDDGGALTDATRDSGGSAHEKDSGISRTTDSEPELPPPIQSPSGTSSSPSLHCALEVSSTTITATEATFGSKTSPSNPPSSALSSPGSEAPPAPDCLRLARSDSEGSLERELACLHKEMETVRLECDRLIAQHVNSEKKVQEQMATAEFLMATMDSLSRADAGPLMQQAYGRLKPTSRSPPPLSPRTAGDGNPGLRRQAIISQHQRSLQKRLVLEDTSSAYNTGGESCRSTPLNMDHAGLFLDCESRFRNFPPFEEESPSISTTALHPPASFHPTKKSPVSIPVPAQSVARQQTPFRFGDVMYTNPENLHQTILLQQRALRQAMIQQAQQLKHDHPLEKGPVPSVCLYSPNSPCNSSAQRLETESEWKVKRRSDGSRYITKRPVRNRLLKERAQQLSNERTGITTDDDTFSELKIGRYWTKEEKKRHMEKARERKKKQGELLRRKMMAVQAPADQAIIDLARKKMMRKKGQQLFDKFTTVQEFLTHGNRTLDGSKALGILSVTTV